MRLTQSENWKVAMSGREGISPEAGDCSTVQFIVREVKIEVLMCVRAGKLAVASSLYRIRQPPPCAAERSPLSPNCSSPSLSHMKPCSR